MKRGIELGLAGCGCLGWVGLLGGLVDVDLADVWSGWVVIG